MSVQMKFINVIAMQHVLMTQWEHTHVNAMMDILVMAFSVKKVHFVYHNNHYYINIMMSF